MPDKPPQLRLLSKSEFEALTQEQRMEYILRTLAYISEQLDQTREQAQATNRAISE
jgi:hypothetical protein